MEGEEHRLRELIAAAELVERETRIERIVDLIRTRFNGRSVLFFTEYKATQSLLMSALFREFGDGCTTFINGDGQADDVVDSSGPCDLHSASPASGQPTDSTTGPSAFLVSTEAAGEGIDLQEHCFTLIHVDLPWNPMRMHQRVGRLNRIGQTETGRSRHNPQSRHCRGTDLGQAQRQDREHHAGARRGNGGARGSDGTCAWHGRT